MAQDPKRDPNKADDTAEPGQYNPNDRVIGADR
jgi:hypothetical protein